MSTMKADRVKALPLPMYQCHKKVRAAKIREIVSNENSFGTSTLVFDEKHDSIFCDDGWMESRQPEVGGYYVEYEDGYSSYSPAYVFETGYTPIVEASEIVGIGGSLCDGCIHDLEDCSGISKSSTSIEGKVTVTQCSGFEILGKDKSE